MHRWGRHVVGSLFVLALGAGCGYSAEEPAAREDTQDELMTPPGSALCDPADCMCMCFNERRWCYNSCGTDTVCRAACDQNYTECTSSC